MKLQIQYFSDTEGRTPSGRERSNDTLFGWAGTALDGYLSGCPVYWLPPKIGCPFLLSCLQESGCRTLLDWGRLSVHSLTEDGCRYTYFNLYIGNGKFRSLLWPTSGPIVRLLSEHSMTSDSMDQFGVSLRTGTFNTLIFKNNKEKKGTNDS